ncbi:Ca(2+)-dependent cysteine protease [Tulasnella sp. 424]|nr:Ca(2+)-dependent cysteine protease [Tulasnella sp. 424]KAG8979093.1 Ca(2+)-dependent cysteine protease [Tulasnella sp. 425]
MGLILFSVLALAGVAIVFWSATSFLKTNAQDKRRRREPSEIPTNKALLIGIHYKGVRVSSDTTIDLNEVPHNEVKTWHRILTNYFAYKDSDITHMLDQDNEEEGNIWPSYENICIWHVKMAQLEALVADVRPRDKRFLFVAAHGGQLQCTSDSTELDGKDEVFYTRESDGRTSKIIKDNDLHRILVCDFPEGASLTVVFEICHSGTLLDLPFRIDQNAEGIGEISDAKHRAEDVDGEILCIAACEDGQKAHDFKSDTPGDQGIITKVVDYTLETNGQVGEKHSLNLVALHHELLTSSEWARQEAGLEAAQTPVVSTLYAPFAPAQQFQTESPLR